jgi:hypothetical protein
MPLEPVHPNREPLSKPSLKTIVAPAVFGTMIASTQAIRISDRREI